MTRTYRDWEHDARNTTKNVTRLGNELRDRWDIWKNDAPYESWKECIVAELGITAQALHDRNYRARQKVKDSVAQRETIEPSQPLRIKQQVNTFAEIQRRRNIAADLWTQGYARPIISEALGVSERTIQTDIAVKGLDGGLRPFTRTSRPDSPVAWRDEDLGIADEESTIQQPSFAACKTPSASEAIEDVRTQLSLILGGRYRLSVKDRNNLITVLTNALERLHNGKEEAQGASVRARVAG